MTAADYVTWLRPGDRFRWCDRAVTLRSVIPIAKVRTTKRCGRVLVVTEDNGTEYRLHYYDDESVHVLPPADGSGAP